MTGFTPTHRHYKGRFYQVRGFDRAERDFKAGEWLWWSVVTDPIKAGDMVVQYMNEAGEVFARERGMFEETLPDGRKRFEPILDYIRRLEATAGWARPLTEEEAKAQETVLILSHHVATSPNWLLGYWNKVWGQWETHPAGIRIESHLGFHAVPPIPGEWF